MKDPQEHARSGGRNTSQATPACGGILFMFLDRGRRPRLIGMRSCFLMLLFVIRGRRPAQAPWHAGFFFVVVLLCFSGAPMLGHRVTGAHVGTRKVLASLVAASSTEASDGTEHGHCGPKHATEPAGMFR